MAVELCKSGKTALPFLLRMPWMGPTSIQAIWMSSMPRQHKNSSVSGNKKTFPYRRPHHVWIIEKRNVSPRVENSPIVKIRTFAFFVVSRVLSNTPYLRLCSDPLEHLARPSTPERKMQSKFWVYMVRFFLAADSVQNKTIIPWRLLPPLGKLGTFRMSCSL